VGATAAESQNSLCFGQKFRVAPIAAFWYHSALSQQQFVPDTTSIAAKSAEEFRETLFRTIFPTRKRAQHEAESGRHGVGSEH